MAEQPLNQQEIANRVYVGPNKTGDNIDAERAANYVWDTVNSVWTRQSSLAPNAYDYVSYTSGSTTDTYTYKSGGSSGTTVQTITVTWTDSTKATLSSIARS